MLLSVCAAAGGDGRLTASNMLGLPGTSRGRRLFVHPTPPSIPPPHPHRRRLQWFLEQHRQELGDEPEVGTAAKLAQQMAYQNKNFLQVGLFGGAVCCLAAVGPLPSAEGRKRCEQC